MALSRLLLNIVVVLSTTAIKLGNMHKDCQINSTVTVNWIECSPYIYLAQNSIRNTTVVKAKGIFPTVLEILANVSNLTFSYNAPFDDRASLTKAVNKERTKKQNQIITMCNSVNSNKFENTDESEETYDRYFEGEVCPIKIADSYGPVFMTKYEEIQPVYLILHGLKQCWRVMVTSLFLACLAGIALWIAVC